MNDAEQAPEVAIPVKAGASGKTVFLRVSVSPNGEVVLIPPPGGGFMLPPTSDKLLIDAVREFRAIARGWQQ